MKGNYGEIMKFLLSVIAVCLLMITAKLYIPEANADISYNDQYELLSSYEFKQAVKQIIEDETEEDFEAIEDVFLKMGNSIKEMITDQCRVEVKRIRCPIDESQSLYKG